MKQFFYFALFVGLVFSCTSTKQATQSSSPAGSWTYSVVGTPEGDFAGLMTVTSTDKQYQAKMTSGGTELPIEKFVFDPQTKKMKGELYYSGALVLFDALLKGDEMEGTMSAEGMNFPFRASRKK